MALFPTYLRNGIRPLRGKGAWLEDEQGNTYLDFTSGLGVTNLGHGHPRVQQAVEEQVSHLWHVSNLFEAPWQEQTAQLLQHAGGLERVFFCNSGAEANEAAIKLARRRAHQQGIGQPEIITFTSSFHGRTLATLTATGQEKVKTDCGPYPAGFISVPFNDLAALEAAVNDQTAGVMLELVQGEGGLIPADPAFVQGVEKLCREKNLLFMVDEVQTGIGRTGHLFAYQGYGVKPDVVTLAKGLGNGLPIGAMMGKEELAEYFGPGSHASTFGGNPVSLAAATAVLTEMKEADWPRRAGLLGKWIKERLQEELRDHPWVQEIRGMGLMIGIQLDRSVADWMAKSREKRLLVLQAGPEVLRLLPPLIIREKEAEQAVDILVNGLWELQEVSLDESVSGV
jgi:acetylornithine/N-succinyldiaminopimelate aminotransferase